MQLSKIQKSIITIWIFLSPLYAYWMGGRRWMIYDLNEPEIRSTFLSDMLGAYIITGVVALVLIFIWQGNSKNK